MTTPAIRQFSRQITEIMPVIVREFARREDNALSRGTISCAQMVALDYLCERPQARLTEIARHLGVRTSSASVLIDRLIRHGLMSRHSDLKDRRVTWIRVTARGRRVYAQIIDQKRRSIAEVFAPLTDSERRTYLRILTKVKSSFAERAGES